MSFMTQSRQSSAYWVKQAARVVMLFCICIFQLGPTYLMANPVGENVVAGSASFDRSGNTLTVKTGNRVIINWHDFSIASGELTKFIQPSASSVALNRVISGNPSSIFGTLSANGQVFLINPNGILIGSGGQINCGSFIASAFNVENSQFMEGGNLRFTGDSTSKVENRGSINAIGGDIFLIAREVKNSGELNAPDGTVGLAAGREILLAQGGSEKVFVRPAEAGTEILEKGIANSGSIKAAMAELKTDGNIYGLAINNNGIIRADGMVNQNGRIILAANSGRVLNTGTLDASGPTGGSIKVQSGTADIQGTLIAIGTSGNGGDITVTGNQVKLSDAVIDASGQTGGGTIRIGGDFQGKNPAVLNATETIVGADVKISADALSEGNGGRVVVWSDDLTRFNGSISARGGPLGGNGGFAEVSGKNVLNYRGSTDLRAPQGKTGTLLLDPKNILIDPAGVDPVATNSHFTDNPDGFSIISGADLSAAIDLATVTLQANDRLFINDDITGTVAGHGLILQAGRFIIIEQNSVISLNGGNFSATINDNAAQLINRDPGPALFSMESGSQILTQGGSVTITHGTLDGTSTSFVEIGKDTSVDGPALINSGAGDINITAVGQTGIPSGVGIIVGSGSVIRSTSGSITLNGTGGSGATNGNYGVELVDVGTQITTATGSISINGTGGGTGVGNNNYGVVIDGSAQVVSTGSGTIIVTGNGGTGLFGNRGVVMSNAAAITSVDGAILVTGTGSAAAGGRDIGVQVDNAATISSTGNATITIQGTAGNGAEDNWGVWLNGGTVTSATGDISITGIGSGTTTDNAGIRMENAATVSSTGSANITMEGRGAVDAPGIEVLGAGTSVIGGGTDTGNITLIADTAAGTDSISISNLSIQSSGRLFLQPLNTGTTIGLGGGAGTFNLSAVELATLEDGFSLITIGRTDGTGTVTINASTFSDPVSIYGGATTINGAIDVGVNDLLIKASGDLNLNSTVTARNATLVTPTAFHNTAGARPFTLTGKFLVYSVTPGRNTLGGLRYSFQQFNIAYPTAPASAGNGLLYSGSDPDAPAREQVTNVELPKFANSYDRFERYYYKNQNKAKIFTEEPAVIYAKSKTSSLDRCSQQNAILVFSSFDLSQEDRNR